MRSGVLPNKIISYDIKYLFKYFNSKLDMHFP